MERLRWILFLGLLVWTAWSAISTVMYMWAAGGPPTPYPEIYVRRAYIYLFSTCASFASAVTLLIYNIRKMD